MEWLNEAGSDSEFVVLKGQCFYLVLAIEELGLGLFFLLIGSHFVLFDYVDLMFLRADHELLFCGLFCFK
jgi:hypothetical protein